LRNTTYEVGGSSTVTNRFKAVSKEFGKGANTATRPTVNKNNWVDDVKRVSQSLDFPSFAGANAAMRKTENSCSQVFMGAPSLK